MQCHHCHDTGKYKQPNNQQLFDELVDMEMDKGYAVNCAMAEERAYYRVGYKYVPCPRCKNLTTTATD